MTPTYPDGRRSAPRPKNWKRLRARVLRRDGAICALCYAPASHVDHIVPVSAGGSDDESNLQSLCARCHNAKTGREANAMRTPRASRKREPERHPGLIDP